jgi:hypothetical protein
MTEKAISRGTTDTPMGTWLYHRPPFAPGQTTTWVINETNSSNIITAGNRVVT